MPAQWQYLYESVHWKAYGSIQAFNRHLNERAAEGWELVTAQFHTDRQNEWHAQVVWRR